MELLHKLDTKNESLECKFVSNNDSVRFLKLVVSANKIFMSNVAITFKYFNEQQMDFVIYRIAYSCFC